MLKIKNEYKKGARKLEKILKKHMTIRNYNAYCNFICKIKYNYKNMFGEDLEKMGKERIRLKLEIECIKNSTMSYVITIVFVTLGFLFMILNDTFLQLSKDFAIALTCIYIMIAIFSIEYSIVNIDRKLRSFIFSLQALEELEGEIRKEINENLTLRKIKFYG